MFQIVDLANFQGSAIVPCMTVANPHDFPSGELADRLSKRLFSRKGQVGISSLIERLGKHWSELQVLWIDRESADGVRTLGLALMRAANTSDRDDLVGLDIPLRTMNPTPHAWAWDANVSSKIGLALLETLACGDVDGVLAIVQAMGSTDHVRLTSFANLIAIPLFIDAAQFDLAIEAAKKNLSVRFCPTSEYMLVKSARAKKESGVPVSVSDTLIGDLSDRFCSQPFDTLSTSNGRLGRPDFFACGCSATLPYPVSNADDELSIDSLWNGESIREIRRSILDGDFAYCSRTMCPYIAQATLPKRSDITDPFLRDIIDNRRTEIDRKPARVSLGHDPSCNLACPSCRSEIVTIKNEQREKLDILTDKIVLPLIADSSVQLFICTDGDPFASRHYRRLIHSLDKKRHARVQLQLLTNGLLFTPEEWMSLGHVQKMIQLVIVSIDGARPETYENLRRPGKWEKITMNMDFLKELRQSGKIQGLYLHFVVQKDNFEEMIEFVELGKQWKVDGINFIRMLNMGSFSGPVFEENDVADPRHPLHPKLLEVLRHPVMYEPQVNLLSLAPLQTTSDALAEDDQLYAKV